MVSGSGDISRVNSEHFEYPQVGAGGGIPFTHSRVDR